MPEVSSRPVSRDYNPEGGLGPAVPALLFLTFIFFLNFATRMMLSPLMPAMEQELGFGHAEAGSLFLCMAAGYCLSMLGGGYLASRLDHRRTIIISILAVGTASLALAAGNSLAMLRLAALALGLGAGPYMPSGLATIASLVKPRYLGRAVSIHELAPHPHLRGGASGPPRRSWPGFPGAWCWWPFGAACLLAGAAFWAWGKSGRFKGEAPEPWFHQGGGPVPAPVAAHPCLHPDPGQQRRGLRHAAPVPGGRPPPAPARGQPAGGPVPDSGGAPGAGGRLGGPTAWACSRPCWGSPR